MENEELAKHGLYLDDISKKVRLLSPDTHQLTSQLIAECNDYISGIKDFKDASENQLGLLMKIKEITEREKFEVFRKRSQLASIDLQKQTLRNKMLAELKEKEIKLERSKQTHESLVQVKREQHDTLQMLCRR